MTLSIRERLLILFASAPDGFSATRGELARKFECRNHAIYVALQTMERRKIVVKKAGTVVNSKFTEFVAGPLLHEELGGKSA